MKNFVIIVLLVGITLLGLQNRRYNGEIIRNMEVMKLQTEALIDCSNFVSSTLEQERNKAKDNEVLNVTVTAYTPCAKECGNDPMVAASMKPVKTGTVAVSRDLFNLGWVFGKKIYIEGHGIFRINDLTHKRYKKRVDVFYWDKDTARKFGKKMMKVALL
jgi:3D (Asp-Asp-Asp) domain-containing protein